MTKWLIGFHLASALLSVQVSAADRARPSVEIRVIEGAVTVQDEGLGLEPAEREAVTRYFQERLGRTPFSRTGAVTLRLKGKQAEELAGRLHAADPKDSQAVAAVLEDTFERMAPGHESAAGQAGGAEPSGKVVVGQDFSVGENEILDSLVVIGGTGAIRGQVNELVLIGSQVDLAPTARVLTHFVSIGSRLTTQPGARLDAQEVTIAFPSGEALWRSITERPFERVGPAPWVRRLLWTFGTFIIAFALGMIYLHLAPRNEARANDYLNRRPGVALGIGVLAQFLLFPGALFLIITVVGIFFVPLYFAIFGLTFVLGHIIAGLWLGARLRTNAPLQGAAALAAGLGILALVRLVPWIGGWISLIATLAGQGAFFKSVLDRIRERRHRGGGKRAAPDQTGRFRPGLGEPEPAPAGS